MSLKLFRSTGYASILSPGETRSSMHPGWVIAAVSLWVGFASNVALWRGLASGMAADILQSLALGAFIAAACGAVLSVLGWRKTLKPAATLLLAVAALAACSIWGQSLPFTGLGDRGFASVLFPPWTSLLRWQVSALLIGLGVVPTVWVWQAQVRRLPGPQQLGINMTGALMAGVALAGSGFLLFRGIS
jgi:glucan phosphoethanolaminetransferase (alkaline phosphatase superfamily)